MNAQTMRFRRFRLILDCILITLFLLLASAKALHVQAGSRLTGLHPQASAGEAFLAGPLTLSNVDLANPGPASVQPAPGRAVLDNNTLAAMIAAENAALTPPIHFVDLPVISR
jgi:hypothetical protein